MSARGPEPHGLAFKAYEIEEFVDIHFFRRVGILVARGARALALTPNQVSVIAAVVGGAGGALLASDRFVLVGVALIFFYGVLDSADGQLARLTGQTSEWGRVLDGVAGYVTHIAAYVAIGARMTSEGGTGWTWALALAAGAATVVQAQLYDYHRTSYATIVVKGRVVTQAVAAAIPASRGSLSRYESMQRTLAGRHPDVEAAVAMRSHGDIVPDADRQLYRESFVGLMPAWNLFGDNVRRYAIAGLALAGALEWFFAVVLLLNVPLLVIWQLQQRADARFLASGSQAYAEGADDGRTVGEEGGRHNRQA